MYCGASVADAPTSLICTNPQYVPAFNVPAVAVKERLVVPPAEIVDCPDGDKVSQLPLTTVALTVSEDVPGLAIVTDCVCVAAAPAFILKVAPVCPRRN